MIRTLILATAVAVALPAAQPASAESIGVRYGDLDLSSQAGRQTLDRRIAAAARSVCRVDQSRALTDMMAAGRCYRDALESTRTRIATLTTKQAVRGTM